VVETTRALPSEQAETRVLVLVRALALEVSRKTNNRSQKKILSRPSVFVARTPCPLPWSPSG
jgi:hypothetical protein